MALGCGDAFCEDDVVMGVRWGVHDCVGRYQDERIKDRASTARSPLSFEQTQPIRRLFQVNFLNP